MPYSAKNQGATAHLDTLMGTARELRDRFQAWRRSRVGLRGALLYVLASPLALAAIVFLAKGRLFEALAAGAAFGLVAVAGVLNRRAILEALVTPPRRFVHRRRVPVKYLAALSLGAGTALAAQGAVGQGAAVSLAFGVLAVVGFHLSYRLPTPRAVMGSPRPAVRDEGLRRALAEAEGRILAIETAALQIGNQELEQRLRRIVGHGRAVLEHIVARPDERFRARKFLNVYLEGAERVASRYARTHRQVRGRQLEQNFRNVLGEIERVFERQLEQLSEHDVFDLDVQIEVLRKQLEREGIT